MEGLENKLLEIRKFIDISILEAVTLKKHSLVYSLWRMKRETIATIESLGIK